MLDRFVSQLGPLHRAFELDSATQLGIQVTLADVDIEEFFAMKTLRSERNKYQEEQNRNKPSPSF